MPELSCEHLEVFAVDPHAAAEEEVRAMAAELLDRRAKDYETNCAHLTLARVADELGCTRDGLDLWFAQTVVADRDQARARIAELEAQADRVREIHHPVEALNVRHHPNGRLAQVCAGCGTDDGNWQMWPCPTIRVLDANPATQEAGR